MVICLTYYRQINQEDCTIIDANDYFKSNQCESMRQQRWFMIGTVTLILSLEFIQAIHCYK